MFNGGRAVGDAALVADQTAALVETTCLHHYRLWPRQFQAELRPRGVVLVR